MGRIIAITGGRKGVGKTSLAINLARCLAELGFRSCLFDAGSGATVVNSLSGNKYQHDLDDVIRGDKSLYNIIIGDRSGIDLIPMGSGGKEIASLAAERLDALVKTFSALASYDFYLLVTAADLTRKTVAFCLAAPEIVLAVTCEPTSLTSAYALLRILADNGYHGRIKVVVNLCLDPVSAQEVYEKFRDTIARYLDIKVEMLGVVFHDEAVVSAGQQSLLKLAPDTPAVECFRLLTRQLAKEEPAPSAPVEMATFWTDCFQYLQMPLELPGTCNITESVTTDLNSATVGDRLPPARLAVPVLPEAAGDMTARKKKAADMEEGGMIAERQASAGSPDYKRITAEKASGARSAAPPVEENNTPGKSDDPVQILLPVLERLATSITVLSREVSQLRAALSGGGRESLPPIGGSVNEDVGVTSKVYHLDLQAFVERNEKQKNNE
ncbi:MAG: hypothetical protein A2505_07905 [Deltaproteobacteria bacterium RIFOXYD12_FULL_55_16]|nr:MAG: hypothetical protein A2505_07905 [Deltaproteobacteria bacterium RIFOXYD12_FULL_55_16]